MMGDFGKLLFLIAVLGFMAYLASMPEKKGDPTISRDQKGPKNGGAL